MPVPRVCFTTADQSARLRDKRCGISEPQPVVVQQLVDSCHYMRVCPKPVCVVSAERRSNDPIAIVHHDADGVNRVVEISTLDHVRPVQRLALGTDRSLFPLLALRTGRARFSLLALDTCFTAFSLGTCFTGFSLACNPK